MKGVDVIIASNPSEFDFLSLTEALERIICLVNQTAHSDMYCRSNDTPGALLKESIKTSQTLKEN